jgi:hypothetical protein
MVIAMTNNSAHAHEIPPPAAALFQIISGIWVAQAVATVAKLGVADLLADGPRTSEDLARSMNVHAEALHRVLRGVSTVGVLRLEEGSPSKFSLTPIGQLLRSNVPGSMRSFMIAETAPGHWVPWAHLDDAVKTGKPVMQKAFGMDPWEYYEKNPEEGRLFSEAMSGLSAGQVQALLGAYSFKDAKKIVDVGGAHGSALAAILKSEPSARGVLFDLPDVVEGAGPALTSAGVEGRVERVAGSFFESVPAGADVYFLKHVLHDWDDEQCVQILKKVKSAMASSSPNAKVVVAEMVIGGKGPPSPAPLLDLNMLVMAGGKERTVEEFGKLFEAAGLKLAGVTPTFSPIVVIEGRPV